MRISKHEQKSPAMTQNFTNSGHGFCWQWLRYKTPEILWPHLEFAPNNVIPSVLLMAEELFCSHYCVKLSPIIDGTRIEMAANPISHRHLRRRGSFCALLNVFARLPLCFGLATTNNSSQSINEGAHTPKPQTKRIGSSRLLSHRVDKFSNQEQQHRVEKIHPRYLPAQLKRVTRHHTTVILPSKPITRPKEAQSSSRLEGGNR